MVYLIYGEDTFRSKEKLEAIKQKYRATSGDVNLIELDAEGTSWEYLQNQISATPFLANKRLVIVKFISKAAGEVRDNLTGYLDKIPSSTVLFFYEVKLDLRLNIFKKICKNSKNCEEFKPLEGIQLRKWIEKRFLGYNLEIERNALDKLIELVGSDLWQISNEVEKIACYKQGKNNSDKVTLDEIELLVSALPQVNIFNLIDSLHGRRLNQSLSTLEALIKIGEDELRILGLIISQFRNLLIVDDIKSRFPSWNNFAIAKESGLKPFVVSKSLGQLRALNREWLKNTYQNLAKIDWQIKTGAIDPHLALNLLTVKVCGNFKA